MIVAPHVRIVSALLVLTNIVQAHAESQERSGDDPWANESIAFTAGVRSDWDWDLLTLDLAPKVEFDPEWSDLSARMCLEHLEELAALATPFTRAEQIAERAKELSYFAWCSRPVDEGGLAYFKTLHRFIRALLALGRDPLELAWLIPMPVHSGFGQAPVQPARYGLGVPLTQTSARFIEREFRDVFERSSRDAEFGLLFEGQMLGHPPMSRRYFIALLHHLMNSGFASTDIATWVAEEAIEQLEGELDGKSLKPVLTVRHLPILARYGVLKQGHCTQLLNAYLTKCFELPKTEGAPPQAGPTPGELAEGLAEIVGACEIDSCRVIDLISLTCAADRLHDPHHRPFRDVLANLVSIAARESLVKDGFSEDVDACLRRHQLDDLTQFKRDEGARVFIRISHHQFTPGSAPQVVSSDTFTITTYATKVIMWSDSESFGILHVDPRLGDYLDIRLYSADEKLRYFSTSVDATSSIRHLLAFRLHVPFWDQLTRLDSRWVFDTVSLEVNSKPFGDQRIPLDRLYALILREVNDLAGRRAALWWLKDRSESFVPALLAEVCERGDSEGNRMTRAAAILLIEKQSWAIFDNMIPRLLKRPRSTLLPPPLFDAFAEVADSSLVSQQLKQGWAKRIVRRHLHDDIHPMNLVRLITLVEDLSGEEFGFDANRPIQENAEAIKAARSWASKRP